MKPKNSDASFKLDIRKTDYFPLGEEDVLPENENEEYVLMMKVSCRKKIIEGEKLTYILEPTDGGYSIIN